MDIRYYEFNTSVGNMIICFSSRGIVCLTVVNGNEDQIIRTVMDKFGQAVRVEPKDYDFHDQIIEYLEGKRKSFSLSLDLQGTEFQKKVWNALLEIPYGETRTYKEVANSINAPKAYRAVGNALNKNPVLILVPCHRVIGSNGKLTGFRGGLDLKAKLLELEKNNSY